MSGTNRSPPARPFTRVRPPAAIEGEISLTQQSRPIDLTSGYGLKNPFGKKRQHTIHWHDIGVDVPGPPLE